MAQPNVYLMTEGRPIEYQDNIAATTCLTTESDSLLTDNKEYFAGILVFKARALTPTELQGRL